MARRGGRWSRVVFVLVLGATGCSSAAGNQPAPPSPPPSTADSPEVAAPFEFPAAPSAQPTPEAAQPVVSLRAVVDAAHQAAAPGSTLGVAVLDVGTDELVEGAEAQRPIFSASLSKLIVVVDMLDRRRTQGLGIAESDVGLMSRALSASDDGAMSALWDRHDGPGAIGRVAAKLGLSGTRAPDDTSQWGETLVTATDFVRLYRYILRDLPAPDRDFIVNSLAATPQRARDGFDQFFGLLRQGASPQVYAKQGWVSYRPSRQYLHSAGVVYDSRTGKAYAIALLSVQPGVSTQTARERLSGVAAAAVGAIAAA